MKKPLLVLLALTAFFGQKLFAQANRVPGPAEKKITDSLCNCIVRLDKSKIKTAKEANDAFLECFGKQSGLLVDLAEERNVSMDDDNAMHDLGIDIGKDLLKEKCEDFMKLAVKMAQKDDAETKSTTEGKFKRIDNKGFNYIVLTDNNNREKSFLWLRQFPGSESFTTNPAQYLGKRIKIDWKEIEVYLPQARGYYKVKEIISLDVE
jgi:hypothetical protein